MLNDSVRKDFLEKLSAGKCSHAYILEGPAGVGKAETAKWFASALLCSGRNPPCGECLACRKVRDGFHPDLHWYGGEAGSRKGGTRAVSVDDVRSLIRETTMLPSDGDRMVFVIEDANEMLAGAQNALLKIFEEPPQGVYLFLLTESRKSLLPTVRSRGQTVVISGEPDSVLAERLRAHYPDAKEKEISAAVRTAGGSFGAAEAFLQKKAAQDRETVRTWMKATFEGSRYDRLSVIAMPKYKRETLLPLLDLFFRMTSDVLLVKSGGQPVLLEAGEAAGYASRATKKKLLSVCDAVAKCRARVDANGNMTADMTELAVSL